MPLSTRQRGLIWLLLCAILVALGGWLGWQLSSMPSAPEDYVIGLCLLAMAAYCGSVGISRLRSAANADAAPARLKESQISLRQLGVIVFLLAFLAFMFVQIFPSLTGRPGLDCNGGTTTKPYRYRHVIYFYTSEDPLLFAIATDGSRNTNIQSSRLDLTNPDLLYGPFTIEHGQETMRVNYDPSARTVEIDGTTFDLRQGSILLFDAASAEPTWKQHDARIDQTRVRRHDVVYLLEAIESSLPAE